MAVPYIDSIKWETFLYKSVYPAGTLHRGIFEWGFLYKESSVPTKELNRRQYSSEPHWWDWISDTSLHQWFLLPFLISVCVDWSEIHTFLLNSLIQFFSGGLLSFVLIYVTLVSLHVLVIKPWGRFWPNYPIIWMTPPPQKKKKEKIKKTKGDKAITLMYLNCSNFLLCTTHSTEA